MTYKQRVQVQPGLRSLVVLSQGVSLGDGFRLGSYTACHCDTSFVLNLESEFKSILGAPADLETWAQWLQSVVNTALASVTGTSTFTKAARQFLLKWSFYR